MMKPKNLLLAFLLVLASVATAFAVFTFETKVQAETNFNIIVAGAVDSGELTSKSVFYKNGVVADEPGIQIDNKDALALNFAEVTITSVEDPESINNLDYENAETNAQFQDGILAQYFDITVELIEEWEEVEEKVFVAVYKISIAFKEGVEIETVEDYKALKKAVDDATLAENSNILFNVTIDILED